MKYLLACLIVFAGCTKPPAVDYGSTVSLDDLHSSRWYMYGVMLPNPDGTMRLSRDSAEYGPALDALARKYHLKSGLVRVP